MPPTRFAQVGAEQWIPKQSGDRTRETLWIAGRDEQTGSAVFEDIAITANIARHDGQTTGHRFKKRVGEPLVMRRKYEKIGGLIPGKDVFLPADETNVMVEHARVRVALKRAAEIVVANKDQRRAPGNPRDGFKQHIVSFDGLQVPHGQDDRSIRR